MKEKLTLTLGLGVAMVLAGTVSAQTLATLTDIGPTAPTAGANDIAQLVTGPANSPDGLNYYFDNGSPPGQTFTTGSDPNGYILTSLALWTAGNGGSIPEAGQAYLLRIYSVSGSAATLIATYTSASDFTFAQLDWLQWTGLSVGMPANGTYAYSFARTGAGWENMGNVSGNPYAGGEVVLIPTGGGNMTLGNSHGYDATFVAGLSFASSLSVNAPVIKPSSAVPNGTAVTLSALAVGPGSITYQWRTDGGSGGALTNIPGSTAATLAMDTTTLAVGVYQYDVVVNNGTSSVTSSTATLTVTVPVTSATLIDLGAAASSGPNDITQLVGGGNRDGLNYYDDNGPNNDGWTGQTFTTGANAQGYYLTSVAFQTGGGGSSGVSTVQPYELFLYSVDGSAATLMAHYTNGAFSFIDGNWLQWSGFKLTLKPNTAYAYAFGRSATGTGWEALAVSPESGTDLYAGGQMCLIPAAGGTMTFGTSGVSDAVFDVGVLPIGVGPDPKPFAGTISVAPSRTIVAGAQVTLTQAATGATPLNYQWRSDGAAGTLTNIPSATGTNLVLDTTGWRPGAYQFDLVVKNAFGSSTATAVTVTVVYAVGAATIEDIGTIDPRPVTDDISQLVNPGAANNPDGMNYYFDNGSPPGQTFTTGSNAKGYTLSSVAIRMAGNRGGMPAAGQSYLLRLYSVSGGTATLYATHTSQDGFLYTASDWLRWSGFAVPLSPNTAYAYTLARSSSGSGWENLANVAGNLCTGGEAVLIPPAGGTIVFGSSHDYDGTFVIGLSVPGNPIVSPVRVSPARTIFAGTPVALSASVTGTGPFTYQWQTDGGNVGGALTNIPGAITTNLTLDTTDLGGLGVTYALVAANASGSTASETSTLIVNPASGPVILTDIAPTAATSFVGGSVTFSVVLDGTLPIDYQWLFDNGAGPVVLVGQTNTTLVLTNLQASQAGSYSLSAANTLGNGVSGAAALTIVPQPTSQVTVNFQWHSTEGGDVGNYTGPGVSGYGAGTYWNQIIGPSSWNPGTFTNSTSFADNGTTDTGVGMTIVTGGSWDWTSTPTVALLDSAASAYGEQTFTFSLPNGVYNVVLFSCNGTEATTKNGGTDFTINGETLRALPTQDRSFVEGDTYVVFNHVVVTGTVLTGTWTPVTGKSYGSLNGAQLQYLGPAVSVRIKLLTSGQLQVEWAQGKLVEASSLEGPWTPNTAATSPYLVTPTGAQKYYRVLIQ